jgi:tricorn protease
MAGGRLFTVAATPEATRERGALPVPLPMPVAGAGDYSPDGSRIVYAPLFRDFRTWKRYEGGWAQDLFVFDPETGQAENVTNHPRSDRDPMWIGESIWFASDRSGTLNLWSYDPRTKAVHQETTSTTWDVRWPSAGSRTDQRIVYEKGGELCWFDCKTRQEQPIAIRVPDEALLVRPVIVEASGLVEDYALSPGGRRAVFAARGEIVTVPKEHGDLRNLTRSPGAHDKHPAFSPDGATVAWISDRSGEEQIWLVDHLGSQPPRQLTKGLAAMIYDPRWSPDGKWIAFSDKDGVLRVCEVATGALTEVADEPRGQLRDYSWSPCSGWLAFSMSAETELHSLFVWSLADKALHRISRPLANDSNPVWSADGERLFFLGLRGFQPRLASHYEWDFQVDRAMGIFALALRQDLASLLPERSDEAVEAPKDKDAAKEAAENAAQQASKPAAEDEAGGEVAEGEAAATEENAEAPAPATPATKIDFDGLADRVEALPIPLDNLSGLSALPNGVMYVKRGGSYYGRSSDEAPTLHVFDLKERQAEQIASGVSGYSLSPDGKHVLIRTGGSFAVAAATTKGKDGQKKIDLRGLPVEKVGGAEYAQIFNEVWRRYRDFFYVANMHGHDWDALRERYAALVPHVRHRSDLNYVLGEMIAELNVGHAYISGGDIGAPERPKPVLLGFVPEFDKESRRYRIARILRGQNDDEDLVSPATAVGVDLREGDYLLAIDGVELSPEVNPFKLLRGKAGRTITLRVNAVPGGDGARTVQLQPIGSEQKLHYLAWVEDNRRRVSEASGGKLGYMHLPDMGENGIREFIRQYYPQRDKQGLVIDDRYNGGGNISQMIVNRLTRHLLMAGFGRTSGYRPYPSALFQGHLICLLNETSASDGDIFPAMFRKAGLGKLVGKRSWGGIIGITNRGMLMDGGTVNVPEFGNTEIGEQWTIEGHGVDPDVVVENDVASVLQGRDPQLEKAIELLLEQVRTDPRPTPTPPPPPVKTGR